MKGMPSRSDSSIQGLSCFEYTCVFSKILKSYMQVSLETTDKYENLNKQ